MTLHRLTCRSHLTVLPALLFFYHGFCAALSPQAVYAKVAASVLPLEAVDGAGKVFRTSSATQIGPQRFVIACEALDEAALVRLVTASGPYGAQVVARDRARNLCFVDVEAPMGTPLPQAPDLPVPGSKVFAVSNALGLGIGISEGLVAGVRTGPAGSLIQFTASVSPGSEGGALVDDEGRLVGVLDYRRRDGQNVNFAAAVVALTEVESRSAAAAAQLRRVDEAAAMQKAEQWQALAAAVADWRHATPDDPDAWRFAVAAAAGMKDAAGELSAWKEWARVSPGNLQVGLGYGEALWAQRQHAAVLAHARMLVASHPADGRTHLLLARAQRVTGAVRDAEASFRTAIDRDPWLVGAYHGLADLALAKGDTATALAIWSRLSGLLPLEAWPRIGLAQAYLDMGQPERADAVLQRLPASARDGAEAWYWRGRVFMKTGDASAAVAAFEKSIAGKPAGEDWVWSGLASALWTLKRFPDAIAAAESAVRLNPDKDAWRYLLLVILKDGNRAPEALAISTALTQRVPDNPAYWRQHGYVLGGLRRMPEAVAALERSLQLSPQQPEVWGALIRAHHYLGQRKDATAAYQRLALLDAKAAEAVYRSEMLAYEGHEGVTP
ncbi:MAG: hypothetical protein JWQ88_518 [Rhodoferax sp.]|nr:hypothetical protein [Rhodoferax sp.]